jgi:hypothetical protein
MDPCESRTRWSALALIVTAQFMVVLDVGDRERRPAVEGRERNLALGIYGAAPGSGAAVGVLPGCVLTSYLSWSWVFFPSADGIDDVRDAPDRPGREFVFIARRP